MPRELQKDAGSGFGLNSPGLQKDAGPGFKEDD